MFLYFVFALVYEYCDISVCLFSNLCFSLYTCSPWHKRSHTCGQHSDEFPQISSVFALWVYMWLLITSKRSMCKSVEPKTRSTLIWASGISTFMCCNWFMSPYRSNFICTHLCILPTEGFGLHKTCFGGSFFIFSTVIWVLVDFNIFLMMLWYCYNYFYVAFLCVCPGRAFFLFSITVFCFYLFGLLGGLFFSFFPLFWDCK